MKKKYLIGLALLIGSILLIFLKVNVSANAQEKNIEQYTDPLVIYDRDGKEVEFLSPKIDLRGTKIPTKVKKLSNGSTYQSGEFSGSGTRYGGYLFEITGTDQAKLTFKKGGFAINLVNSILVRILGGQIYH